MGIVNRVVADEDLDAEAAKVTARIAILTPEAVTADKRLVNQVTRPPAPPRRPVAAAAQHCYEGRARGSPR